MICAALRWWQPLSANISVGRFASCSSKVSALVMKWVGCTLKEGGFRALDLLPVSSLSPRS